jgi:hypothetical protein
MTRRRLAEGPNGLELVDLVPPAQTIPDEVLSPVIGKVHALAMERGESPLAVLEELIEAAMSDLGIPPEALTPERRAKLRLVGGPRLVAVPSPPDDAA